MLLRPYQEVAINDAADALDKHGNTLVALPLEQERQSCFPLWWASGAVCPRMS